LTTINLIEDIDVVKQFGLLVKVLTIGNFLINSKEIMKERKLIKNKRTLMFYLKLMS